MTKGFPNVPQHQITQTNNCTTFCELHNFTLIGEHMGIYYLLCNLMWLTPDITNKQSIIQFHNQCVINFFLVPLICDDKQIY